MIRKVRYEAADRKAGMTAEEARRALQFATTVVKVTITWGGKLRTIEVEEEM